VPITFGHVEVISDEVKKEYLKWLETDEGKSYLEGGSNYKKEAKNEHSRYFDI